MIVVVLALLVGLFAFGDRLAGFDIPLSLQLALLAAFLFGTVIGYRAKG